MALLFTSYQNDNGNHFSSYLHLVRRIETKKYPKREFIFSEFLFFLELIKMLSGESKGLGCTLGEF